jgi:F420H(2)-dependent quinone reductase
MKLPRQLKDGGARVINRLHPLVYHLSGRRIGAKFAKAPVLLLTTTGRKSAKGRTIPLLFLRDDAAVVIVASYGGDDRSPAWFHNLVANPDVTAEIDGHRHSLRATVADAATKARLWPRLVQMYPGYASYQQRTKREIPVVLLKPR